VVVKLLKEKESGKVKHGHKINFIHLFIIMALIKSFLLKPPILVMLILLLMPFVSSFAQHTTFDDWGLYQHSQRRLGAIEYTDQSGLWNGTDHITTYNAGSDFQPLSADIDYDTKIELITSNGNYLQVFSLSSLGILTLEDEFNFGSPQLVMSSLIGTAFDDDNFMEIVSLFGTNLSVMEFNGSDLVYVQSVATGISSTYGNATSGLVCEHFTGAGTNYSCYFSDNHGNVLAYNLEDNALISYSISASDIFTSQNGKTYSPAMEDIDRDGIEEIIFNCNPDLNDYEGLCVFDQSTKALDTGFSVDGIIDDVFTGVASCYVKGTMAYNMNGAGDTEIIATGYCRGATHVSSNEDGFIIAYKADGSEYITSTKVCDESSGTAYCSVSVPIADVFYYEICVLGEIQVSGGRTSISCFDGLTGEKSFYYITGNHNYAEYDLKTIVGADMVQDGRMDIVTGNFIYTLDRDTNTTTELNLSQPVTTVGHPILVDLDNDNNLDVCIQKDSLTACIFPQYDNNIPEFTRDLGVNYISPVCTNTSVTWSGRECGAEPCHYTNDFAGDPERLSATCGYDGGYVNGSYTSATQSYSCFFNTSGTYNFNIYLQDNVNSEDYTEYQTQSVYVIDGETGIDCNFPVSEDISTGESYDDTVDADDELTSEEDIRYAVELVTLQSAYMKALLVLLFTVIFMIALAKYAHVTSPFIYAISCFMLWISFAVLGLLAWIYVIIYAVVALGLTSVLLVTSGNKE